MTSWMDAIYRLRLSGYSVSLVGGKLRYAYQGKGNPSQDEITPLLEVLKTHKAEILKNPYFLIEQTIHAINKHWESGTLGRFSQEARERISVIEQEINRTTLAGDIEGLRKGLEEYRSIFSHSPVDRRGEG
jgi:hypothetical protein